MSSETITRNDLKAILDKVFPLPTKAAMIATGSVSVTATSQTLTFCTITLQPNSKYLILTNVSSSKGTSLTLLNNVSFTNAPIKSAGTATRVTTTSGQGLANWRYVEIGDSSSDVSLVGYSYPDGGTGYTQSGQMVVIPISTPRVDLDNYADYVVDQGTDGIWTYRKWASGIAECWGFYQKQIAANTVDINTYLDYPFTFTAKPVTTLGLQAGGADLYHGHIEGTSSNASRARIILVNKYTSAVTLGMNIHAMGRWK